MNILDNLPTKIISNKVLNYVRKEFSDLHSLKSLSEISNFEFSYNNSELLRQKIFDFFRTKDGIEVYKKLIIFIAKKQNLKDFFVQKVPTIRIHLIGRGITSFHCDSWYGHHVNAWSFWIPLTKVFDSNSLWIFKNKQQNDISYYTNYFNKKKLSLVQIDDYFSKNTEPCSLNVSQGLAFNGNEIHGTVINNTTKSRISFDFRIAEKIEHLATKPMSNYWNFKNGKFTEENNEISSIPNVATYSTFLENVPSKNQILMASVISRDMGFNIIRNESEIINLNYLPVLKDLILSSEIDGVIIYSDDILRSKKIKDDINYLLRENNKFLFISSKSIYYNG